MEANEYVRKFQQALIKSGYQLSYGADGKFGSETLELSLVAIGKGTARPTPTPTTEPPWLRIARAEVGVRETPGAGNTPRVVEYLQSCNKLDKTLRGQDATPWCSAFVNWVIEEAGFVGTNSAWARDWLSWGVRTTKKDGAIVVLERGSGGHVGFCVGDNILGGNQGDAVSIVSLDTSRVLGYRWVSET